jgi:cytoplasmic iron level regulating protein YaaA (DUF328/UPF0246 family)
VPLTILLHSSKTMMLTPTSAMLTKPRFMDEARSLHWYVQGLSDEQLQKSMHISAKLAETVRNTYKLWRPEGSSSAAIETFRGDIFSGLRALDFNDVQRSFAQQHLCLLSGMYGLLKPYDAVYPYRLEAGYKFPDPPYTNMYEFWSDRIAGVIPTDGPIINVTSAEYDALVLPYVAKDRVITPKFLTVMPNASEPKFVAVHAKIARGAYARWLIMRGRDDAKDLDEFNDLGYVYDSGESTEHNPVYICRDFKGIGLSQRLV